jgi:release factor glutamine methyltransferase
MSPTAVTIATLLDDATARIGRALSLERREARLEARVLAAFAWEVAPAWLVAHDTDVLAEAPAQKFASVLARRLAGEPIAYINGKREFYGRDFLVTPDVLIPRPETEHLVDAALASLPADQAIDVLDIGTGSGAIGLTLALERPRWRITAIDCSAAALAVARKNADHLGIGVELLESNLFSALPTRRFHLIVSNPPYVAEADPHLGRGDARFEPRQALASGAKGLDLIRQLIAEATTHLLPGGRLLIEHGADQADDLITLLRAACFVDPFTVRDLAGLPRVTGGTALRG